MMPLITLSIMEKKSMGASSNSSVVRYVSLKILAHFMFLTSIQSAGGHLSVLTALHISSAHPLFDLRGLVLLYGAFDLSNFLPAVHQYPRKLVIDGEIMTQFINAFLPNTTAEQRRDPAISPFYAALNKANLPPALFAVGTEDPLLDDSVLMANRWVIAGKEAILKVYPGAPHGFMSYPHEQVKAAGEGYEVSKQFILEKLG